MRNDRLSVDRSGRDQSGNGPKDYGKPPFKKIVLNLHVLNYLHP